MAANWTRMDCPRCAGTQLQPGLTKPGVEVDTCPSCGGVWLDKGEIFYFAAKPKVLTAEINKARALAKPGDLVSPKTGKAMDRLMLFDEVEIDQCPDSKGLWLDRGEMRQILAHSDAKLNLEMDARVAASGAVPAAAMLPATLKTYALSGRSLPNLTLRSVGVLTFLYGLLAALLILLVEVAGLPPGGAVLIGVVVAALQFGLGPIIMDWSLRGLFQCRWVTPDELPPHLRAFVQKVVDKHGKKFPRMGIIQDGAPNAFTYGHHPNNARVVLTRGLMELLDERELEAVTAHELGHALRWDTLIMTMAYLVPLIAYYVYRTVIRIRVRGRDKTAAARLAIAVGAFIVYIVSQYIVLWLSRTREYGADRFAGEATGDPNALSSALVKIGYGLAGRPANAKEREKAQARGQAEPAPARATGLEALGAMGIFSAGSGRSLAIASARVGAGGSAVDTDNLKGAMCWDLWNPWARFYELGSTHPLIASRLDHLSRQAATKGQAPYVMFDDKKPESYWDEFLVDLFVLFLPYLLPIAILIYGGMQNDERIMFLAISGYGAGLLLRTLFSYRGGEFPEMSIAGLLKNVKVSGVRGVPCTLRGTVIGRGVPGLILSEDFVIRDDTGIIFLDYRQPLHFIELLFGLMRRASLDGQEVVARGWYRRAPVPFVELRSITGGGKTRGCYALHAKIVWACLLIAGGVVAALMARA